MLTPRRLAALAGLAVAAVVLLSPAARTLPFSLLLLPHFFPGAVPRPLERLTPAPRVSTLTSVPGAQGMVADVYRPAGDGRYPALILLLGVNPLPRQHPQVTTLADGLARTGIVTVVAESEALLRGEIRPEEVDNLVALFTYLEADPGVDPDRMGFGGFCVGAVLEILAASDERIADHVAYVNGFSVYADARDVVRAVLSRSMPTPTGRVDWQPDAMTREVFVRHLILALPTSRDRAFLSRERVEGTPLTSPEVQALTPLGQELRDLLVATEPAEIDRRMAALPADYLATLDRLSPAASIGRLRAETFLMHDESDTYLPVSGARQLARLLPAAARGHYTEFHLFQHVVPGRTENSVLFAGEMVKLLQHVNAVLTVIRHGGAAASRLR